jgi:beta-glucanase (GH16 family)
LFRYGRYETRVKAPVVQPNNPTINGNYIASLFVYRQPACQQWREIDLEITGDSPGALGTNLIYSNNDCVFTPDKEQFKAFDLAGINFRTGFQTIGFEWLPGKVTYYYLDAMGVEVTLRQLVSTRVPDVPAKIMANLWMFDDTFAFGGPAGQNDMLPFRSEYDFFRFYKWDGDDKYPCLSMDASCLSADDLDLAGNNGCDGIPNTGDIASCGQCGTTRRVACTAACP